MIWCCCALLLSCYLVVDAQPLSCEEDAHCSQGYYCEIQEKRCYQCLQCEDLNRLMPRLHSPDSCVESIYDCGPCFEGFISIFEVDDKGMCVPPHWLQHEISTSFCFYAWMTAVIITVLIVIIFMYVIWNTYVYEIVPNYDPIATSAAPSNDQLLVAEPRRNILKQILQFFKDMNDHQRV